MSQYDDLRYMQEALELAREAAAAGETPVGAIIVTKTGEIIGRGRNRTEELQQPAAHAEMFAIESASAVLASRRLSGTTLYVTLEPCPMCAGAIVLARITRLVYAAPDPKAGACQSLFNITDDNRLNHRCVVRSGVLEEESAALLKDFFRGLRDRKQ